MKSIPWDGKRISKPGLYSNVPLSLYHAHDICDGPSISSSGLRKIFNESAAHFYDGWPGNPDAVEREDTKALIIGRAAHHLFMGEPFFAKLFAIQPAEYIADKGEVKPWNNNAKDCKTWHAERAKEGRSVLTDKDVASIKGMSVELGKHPIIRAGALNGQIERSVFWKDKKTGVWVKIRPDSIPNDSGDFVDLKTTDSTLWDDLVRTLGSYAYHQQGALVREGARIVLGIANPTFTLVFVEKKRPHTIRVVTIKDNDLDRGMKQNRIALDTFAECLRTKRWPGPGGDREDAEHIELSEREQKRIDLETR